MTTRFATAVLVIAFAGAASGRQRSAAPAQTETDQYARYELLAPETHEFRMVYEVSATTEGARQYVVPVLEGSQIRDIAGVDLMTGAPLAVTGTAAGVRVDLARPVPPKGQGRIQITMTVKQGTAYGIDPDANGAVFRFRRAAWRGSIVLPAGFAVSACNVASRVITESDGRVVLSFMQQGPGYADLEVRARRIAPIGAAAAPTPLTDARSWEPPPSQGPTERARLAERAHQDRDIVYFLQEPSTHAFSLYHDYTESRPGVDKYLNVVRTGSRVSNTSAVILDTGEALKDETLRGPAITAAGIEIGQAVTPDTEVVVVHFPAVKAGQSVRLRISETYTAPQSYRLEGPDLVFDRSLGRPRNSVVLPAGWYLTASSIPAVIRETPDGKVRLDFVNGRTDSIDVLIKGRHIR